MVPFLRTLSGILFFALGSTFFIAYLLVLNGVYPVMAAWWLQVADLPLVIVSLVYGGSSLYMSVKKPGVSTKALPWIIILPLTLLFLTLAVFNFWPAGAVV